MVWKGLYRVVCFLWMILLVIGIQESTLSPVTAQSANAVALVDAVNAYRESLGLPRLQTSPALMVAAQRHVEWMAANYNYSHTGAGGSTPQSRATAAGFSGSVNENVAGGTTNTPGQTVFFWDQSSVHKRTMRLASATHIGAGYAANDQQLLFVLLIGTASGQSPLPASQPVANGTPAIDYTPPAGMSWTINGQTHTYNGYSPISPPGTDNQQSSQSTKPNIVPTEVAYVMPLDLIQRAEPREDGSVVHVVEMGQTAWAIAIKYEVDLADILALNHLPENPVLYPGDELIIHLGEGQSAPSAPIGPNTYQVKDGESLWTIAAKHNLSVEDLRAWNNLTVNDYIQPGDSLVLSAPIPAPTLTHTPTATVVPSATPMLSPSPLSTVTATLIPPSATLMATTAVPTPLEVAQIGTPVLVELSEQTSMPDSNPAVFFLVMFAASGMVILMVMGTIVVWLIRKRYMAPSDRNDRPTMRRQ